MGATDSPFWQARAGHLGEAVFGLADLDQAIRLVVQTPPMSVPLEPEFGCALQDHLDKPAPQAAPAIIRAVTKALQRWEPRIALGQIDCHLTATHAAHLTIYWRPSDSGQQGAYSKTEIAWA